MINPKRFKARVVKALENAVADEIVAMSRDPERHCCVYWRTPGDPGRAWAAFACFSRNEPDAPAGMTCVRLRDEGKWGTHRPFFLTTLGAAEFAFEDWITLADFAFAFSKTLPFPMYAGPEYIRSDHSTFDRVEFIHGNNMLDDIAIVGRMLGTRFYPTNNVTGIYYNFEYPPLEIDLSSDSDEEFSFNMRPSR
jgi:hypothetical protein